MCGSLTDEVMDPATCVSLCVSGSGEAPGRASYHKYHIQRGWCLGRSLGCLLGLGIAEVWPRRLLSGTKETKKREHGRQEERRVGREERQTILLDTVI